ncbi:DUF317 domain-containing protein [Streptomyces sp. NPDC056835]|uniref:DUF317 domain-containing protein n=1 Tax=Streptomyces sp. NPDC056835 TaxID=3345956 RepID=UPI00368FAF52
MKAACQLATTSHDPISLYAYGRSPTPPARSRSTAGVLAAEPEPPAPTEEIVPTYAADPGDHDAVLDQFLATHRDWEKRGSWTDNTTHAIHESQILRIERVHEAEPREIAWTVAADEIPVSDRMWHLAMTGLTPAPVLLTLLNRLAEQDAWETAVGSPVTEKTPRPPVPSPTRAGNTPWTDDGSDGRPPKARRSSVRRLRRAEPAHHPRHLDSVGRPTWAIHASPYASVPMTARLTGELAHGTGTRQPSPAPARHRSSLRNQPPSHRPPLSPRPADAADRWAGVWPRGRGMPRGHTRTVPRLRSHGGLAGCPTP